MRRSCALLLFAAAIGAIATPLDDYVKAPDPVYSYSDSGRFVHFPEADSYQLNLTSQQWLTDADTDRPIWQHTLMVTVPKEVRDPDYAVLLITGGQTSSAPPDANDGELQLVYQLAARTGIPFVSLYQIPNQPLVFSADPQHESRTEDGIIAFSWAHYMNNSVAEWLPRLPMTKAAVKAMDAVQDWAKKKYGINPTKWVVMGASKRGWTTWTTGAVDSRVVGIVPIVLDVLNLGANIHHMYRSYGGWSFAFNDYYRAGVLVRLDTPEFANLAAIVDPYAYRSRYAGMPKLIITGADDEFMLVDDDHYWWDDLPEPKQRLIVGNATHGMVPSNPNVLNAIAAFVLDIVEDLPPPQFAWKLDNDAGTISITEGSNQKATKAIMRRATTVINTRRDFRWRILAINGTCPPNTTPAGNGFCSVAVNWEESALTPVSPGEWLAQCQAPESGYASCFVELHYVDAVSQLPYYRTTQAVIQPNTFPFPDCSGAGCTGSLL
eukprot:TRINITY_DN67105_c0_g1_i1.p1 TRINITY_DN67105_c0_g1~~TRINITY_DN67105_c0_g1_i1.p1  ORF type:complete len:493 (-),score=70.15 TRINITY_DN67105_c0_g1_i1:5-1483(-)